MAHNFLSCDRDQPMLLPPDLRDWLDDDHLVWFVIDAVSELDLEPFYAAYRTDGHGRAAHDPQMMVTLFAYAFAVGERSSRGIERRCREDVAFRVICANQAPDHATIARFRVRHEAAVAERVREANRVGLREPPPAPPPNGDRRDHSEQARCAHYPNPARPACWRSRAARSCHDLEGKSQKPPPDFRPLRQPPAEQWHPQR
jgi:transposase